MPEMIVSLAMRDGRIIGFRRQLGFIAELADLSPEMLDRVTDQVHAMGPGPARAVIRASGGTASVSRRPLIDVSDEVVMSADPVVDQRLHPNVPGADLGWLGQQRTRTAADGSDEALLRVSSGYACAGLNAHIIAFADDVAFVSSHPRTPPSLYVQLVLEVLREEGVEVRHREEGLSRNLLRTNETWTLSPVNGVRRVRAWNEYGTVLQAASLPAHSVIPGAREVDGRLWAAAEKV